MSTEKVFTTKGTKDTEGTKAVTQVRFKY